jgi:hypothetical protein
VVGDELAIEQGEVADLEPRDEPRQRDLRRVGGPAEHRFAEEGAAQLDPVEPTDEIAPAILADVPALDRMSETGAVEAARGLLDGGVDPRLLAVGAGQHDLVERLVMGDGEAARAKAASERARAMEALEREVRALPRLDPEDVVGVATVGHREDACGIATKQQAGVEWRAHRERGTALLKGRTGKFEGARAAIGAF